MLNDHLHSSPTRDRNTLLLFFVSDVDDVVQKTPAQQKTLILFIVDDEHMFHYPSCVFIRVSSRSFVPALGNTVESETHETWRAKQHDSAHVYRQDQGSVETSARKSVGRSISNEDWTAHRDLTVCPTESWQMGVSKSPLSRQCNVAIWQPVSFVLIW